MATYYEVTACDETGDVTSLHECDTVSGAREFVRRYTAMEDAGGWKFISCNAVPFDGDYEFSWERGEGFIS